MSLSWQDFAACTMQILIVSLRPLGLLQVPDSTDIFSRPNTPPRYLYLEPFQVRSASLNISHQLPQSLAFATLPARRCCHAHKYPGATGDCQPT